MILGQSFFRLFDICDITRHPQDGIRLHRRKGGGEPGRTIGNQEGIFHLHDLACFQNGLDVFGE